MELMKYANMRFQLLARCLRRYKKSPDTGTLHQIRLEIKKIKAILKLTDACVKRFNARKNYIPFRTIFQQAGKIREPELMYVLLMRYEIGGIPDSLIPQSILEASLSKQFQEEIPSFIRDIEEEERKIGKDVNKIRGREIERYIKSKKKEFRLLLQSKWNRGTLHKSRKVAKEIIYLSAVTKKTKTDLDPFYDKIQDAIGKWHDKQMLMPILKANGSRELGRLRMELRGDVKKIKSMAFDFYR
jgi:CHAD domain-containing protein